LNQPLWKITVNVLRQKGPTDKPHFQSFPLEIHPDEYVLDAIEKIWAFQDRSLTFRHACHHATCGACGMRVNGKEKLTCITSLHTVVKNNGVLKIEPLRNFPVLSDLVTWWWIWVICTGKPRKPISSKLSRWKQPNYHTKLPQTAHPTNHMNGWWIALNAVYVSAPARQHLHQQTIAVRQPWLPYNRGLHLHQMRSFLTLLITKTESGGAILHLSAPKYVPPTLTPAGGS